MDILEVCAQSCVDVLQGVESHTHAARGGAAGASTHSHGNHNEKQGIHIQVLEAGHQIPKAFGVLYHTTEANHNSSVQDGYARVSSALVEDLELAIDATLYPGEEQDGGQEHAREDRGLYRETAPRTIFLEEPGAVKEQQDDTNWDQSDIGIG